MQIKVTDPATGITIVRDVERVDMRFPNSSTGRKIEVYLLECICMGTKVFGQPNWIEKPLTLDLNNTKVVQAIQLLKEVIEVEERNRIVIDHNLSMIHPKNNGK
jgi:hypothetical protein